MLAKLAEELPVGDYLYEPKWDGFRAIVFRGKDDVYVQSRDSRPLDRYFPDLHDVLLERLPKNCVVDGEIVIVSARRPRFRCAATAAAPCSIARAEARETNRLPRSSLSMCLRSVNAISWMHRRQRDVRRSRN